MSSEDIRFDILARDRASAAFDKVSKSVDRTHGSLSKFASAAKIGAVAGAALGVGLFAAARGLGSFVADARESERVGKLTAQVIKTTGSAANVTAKQVGALATAISNKTGIDDEAVQSASNLLLTFTNVRNEVGKGNDIFNRATQSAVDMATVLGGDAASQSIALGKALNDPIKGVTALSRVGVSFTAQQKTQIKTLVESGNVLGAQKVILNELGKEFGGAAAAAATPMDKLRVVVGNLKEGIGTALLPVVDRFATFMLDKGVPALMRFGGAVKAGFAEFAAGVRGTGDGQGRLAALGAIVTTKVVPAFRAFGAWFTSVGLPAIRNYIGYWRDTVIPVIGRIYAQVIPAAVAAFNHVRDAIAANRPQLQELWAKYKQVADFVITKLVPVLGPILAGTLKGMAWLIGNAITTIGRLVTITKLWWTVTGPILRLVAGAFLAMAGQVVHAAAVAFGWVPGIGPKLRAADKEFSKFKDSVNRSISGITAGKTVTVTAYGRVSLGGGKYTNVPINAATGGYISGPGGPRDDQIPARLSNGEFVVNAAATSRARPLLEAINGRGYADGGVVARTSTGLGSWPAKYEAAIAAMMTKTAQRLLTSSTTGAGSYGGGGSGGYRDLGRRIAAAMGYASQFGAIDYIATRESGWNPRAQNPTSTAYGIFQFLNGTWAGYGGKTSDPSRQISAGIRYMRDRYGSPNGAADFWRAHHWYGNGGVVPGSGPQPAVVHGGERILTRAQRRAYEAAPNVTINISGALDPVAVARQVEQALVRLKNSNGGLAFQ